MIATSGGVTTAGADASDITWDPAAGSIASYTIEPDSGSVTVGTDHDWTVTAFDAASNPVTGAAAQTVLNGLTHTITDQSGGNMNGPESGTVSLPSEPFSWTTSGTLALSNAAGKALQFFNSTNNVAIGDVQIADNQGVPVTATNAGGVTVNSGAGHHFHTTPAGFTGTDPADNSTRTATSLVIELQDQYGNPTTDAGVLNATVAINRVSGVTNTGVLRAALTDAGGLNNITTYTTQLDFNASSTQTLFDFAYTVPHVVEVIATSGGVTTAGADAGDISFDPVAGTIVSYTIEPDSGSVTAGSDHDWTVTAFDAASNALNGATAQTVLNGLTHTITDQSGGNMNGPESGTVSLPSEPFSWTTSGTLALSNAAGKALQFFHAANNVTAGDVQVADNQGVPVTATNTGGVTVNPDSGHHVHVTAAGFPGNADGSRQNSTSITLELQDQYGNPTQDAAANSMTLSVSKTAGSYTNVGTVNAATTDGAGLSDITTINPNFTSTTQVTLHDLSSQVVQSYEILATQGGITTAGADSADLSFNMVAATVKAYDFTLDGPAPTAGANTNATLTARDGANNILDAAGDQATLNGINFTFTTNSAHDAPNASQTAAGNDPADGTKTFSAGATTLVYKFFDATATVAAGHLQVDDTTNSITELNTNTLTINPGAATDYILFNPTDQTAGTATTVNVEAHDGFGNIDTAFGTDVTVNATGSATPTPQLVAITAGTGSYSLNDTVAETVTLSLNDSQGAGITLSANQDVVFSPGPADNLFFATEPVANETQSKDFATQPVVHLRDANNNILTGDNSTVITLNPFTNGTCAAAAGGTLNSNTATVSGGIATFAGLDYTAAEAVLHLEASGGGATTDCSAATQVFATMSIDNATPTVTTGGTHRFEITGGVPPLSAALTADNSNSGTPGTAFTGGGCPGGKICFNYVGGDIGGGVSDTWEVTDSANSANSQNTTITVNGADFDLTAGATNYGTITIDQQTTFTFTNNGNATSGAVTMTFTPDDAGQWSDGATDTCNTADLAGGGVGSCDYSVTFLANTGTSGTGPYSATLTITGANGASLTITLNATDNQP